MKKEILSKAVLFILAVTLVQFFSQPAILAAQSVNGLVISAHCSSPTSPEKLYAEDFKWGYSLAELISRFTEIYQISKRLNQRAYWDSSEKKIKLPYGFDRGGSVVVPESFIENISRHIEVAFKKNLIDGVFFPDMGHSHFLIPTDHYEASYSKFPVSRQSRMYERLFSDREIKILYHTAEQLQTRDDSGALVSDPRVQFRFQNRNLVGLNDGTQNIIILQNSSSPANTAHDLEGHTYYGAGFNLSANEKGCFRSQRQGEDIFFDMSLFDLEYENGGVLLN
jgi:hypothetical protein